ncbi:MAG: hypothetical protein ACRDOH_26740 [Streptosporangiaceae bacterium]
MTTKAAFSPEEWKVVLEGPEMDYTRDHSAEELRGNGLAHLRSAVTLLESKATTGELGDYRRFVVTLAGKADASPA